MRGRPCSTNSQHDDHEAGLYHDDYGASIVDHHHCRVDDDIDYHDHYNHDNHDDDSTPCAANWIDRDAFVRGRRVGTGGHD